MKISTTLFREIYGQNKDFEMEISEAENGYFNIFIGEEEYGIHGTELEEVCRAFLANRKQPPTTNNHT